MPEGTLKAVILDDWDFQGQVNEAMEHVSFAYLVTVLLFARSLEDVGAGTYGWGAGTLTAPPLLLELLPPELELELLPPLLDPLAGGLAMGGSEPFSAGTEVCITGPATGPLSQASSSGRVASAAAMVPPWRRMSRRVNRVRRWVARARMRLRNRWLALMTLGAGMGARAL